MSGELRYRSNYRPRRRGLTPLQIAGIMIAAIVVLIVAIVGIAKVAGGHDSGSSTTTAAAPCATTKVIPAEVLPNTQTVRVNVYNSTKTAGLAKSVAGVLGARGFVIHKVANDPKGNTVTGIAEIRYGPATADAAQLLTYYFPGAILVNDARSKHVVDVAIGSAYSTMPGTAQIAAALASPSPSTSGPGCSPKPGQTSPASGGAKATFGPAPAVPAGPTG